LKALLEVSQLPNLVPNASVTLATKVRGLEIFLGNLANLCLRFAALLLLIAAGALTSSAQIADTEPHTVTLKGGQVTLLMKLVKRLSSARAKAGDDVLLKLSEPILAERQIVLPQGSAIHARITDVNRATKNCQYGSIHWQLEPLTLPGGAEVEIRFLDEGDAISRLERAARDSAAAGGRAVASKKTAGKKGSPVVGILKGIAVAPVAIAIVPLEALFASAAVTCPGGKGREESFWAAKSFFAEVVEDVSIIKH
jgi:hypothetical protein